MRIGIEIGTHTARAAYLDAEGHPQLVDLPGIGPGLPAFARQTMHSLVVGPEAANALVGNAETTVYGCTRLMGRAGELPQQLLERLPYSVREVAGEVCCNLLYAEVRAGDIYGRLVRTLVDAAQAALGQPVDGVVLTVPASAEDRFRVQARAAAQAQGITVHRLLNQPAAALLALDHQQPHTRSQRTKKVAVVSCSGGTTEVTLAKRSSDGVRILATAGDPLLGGDDFAWQVAEQLNERFRRSAGIDVFGVGDSRVAAQGLRASAEEALQRLAHSPETMLVLDHGGGFGRDLITLVRRADTNEWLQPLLMRVAGLCRRVLEMARLQTNQVDTVMLIGDWAYLPQLQETIAEAFGTPVATLHTAGAEALAVYGAAIAAADNAPTVWDVTPYPLGINCYYGNDELLSPIIKANTPIPTPAAGARGAYTQQYQTRFPDQTRVTLKILQYRGPREPDPHGVGRVFPHECEELGTWEFSGLKPKQGHCADFTVTFAVDADGILQLYAKETATGHSLSARVDRGIG